MTWAEHLKANGATAEEIALLDTAPARRAFDKQMADAQAAIEAANAEGTRKMEEYRGTMNQWYEEKVVPDMTAANAAAVTAKADAERAKAAILAAAQRDEGLKQVAINMGWQVEGAAPIVTNNPANPNFDPTQYFKRDEVVSAFEKEADAIALAQDIAIEHSRLFPGQTLSFRDLQRESKAAKQPLEQFWMNKYKVGEARAAQAAASKKADEDKIRAEERTKVESEMASRYGNPMTRPLTPSTSPFTKVIRPDDGKQPWERGDNSSNRVQRATEAVIKKQQGLN